MRVKGLVGVTVIVCLVLVLFVTRQSLGIAALKQLVLPLAGNGARFLIQRAIVRTLVKSVIQPLFLTVFQRTLVKLLVEAGVVHGAVTRRALFAIQTSHGLAR